MRSSLPAALVAACVLVGVPGLTWAGKTDVYAIVGARVLRVDAPALERGTLLLRDGVIEAVAADVKLPPDARVLDGTGLTLTPGLIDAYGSIGLPAPPKRAEGASGGGAAVVSAPIAPQARAFTALKPADAAKARDTGLTTALVVPREGVLPGRSVLVDLAGDTAASMVLREPAALHLQLVTAERQYPNSLMGVMALARQQLYDARRYGELWADYEQAPAGKKRPRYDEGLQAWQDVLAGRIPLVVTALRPNDVRRALALADEFKLRLIVAGAPQAARLAPLIKQRGLPLVVSVNFDPPRPVQEFHERDEERDRADVAEAERNPARLHEAGVRFALGSGHARDFMAGVRKAVERGLPKDVALAAITLRAAEVLGIADRSGSLTPGKLANVVAWSGEPLTKEAKPKWIFVDGALYEPDAKGRDKDGPKEELELEDDPHQEVMR